MSRRVLDNVLVLLEGRSIQKWLELMGLSDSEDSEILLSGFLEVPEFLKTPKIFKSFPSLRPHLGATLKFLFGNEI